MFAQPSVAVPDLSRFVQLERADATYAEHLCASQSNKVGTDGELAVQGTAYMWYELY